MDEKNITAPENAAAPAKTFGMISEEYANPKKAKVAILEVPYEKTVTYRKGTRNGPAAIIEASANLELFDEELNQETYKVGIYTVGGLGIEEAAPQDMVAKVSAATQDLLKSGKFPVLLGGEHSITIGAVKAFKEAYPNLSVLYLDAHGDLRDEYMGSKFNHACVARRLAEICPVVQAGTRSLSKEEKDFLMTQANGRVKTMNVYDILEMPLWKDVVSSSLTENVYVSLDLDVFDPSLVPGVGTPEPGGIGWYEMLDLLREISKDRKIVGFDIVELAPMNGSITSDFFAAKLLYRLLGYVFINKK